jgi:phosphoenolpyruvate synthase/pyruvate phosphate dikinase
MNPGRLVLLAAAGRGASPVARAGTAPTTPGTPEIGFKAARLGAALRAGLPVLPGWVVPVAEGKSAIGAGADAVRARGLAAGRVAVLGLALDADLVEELRWAVDALGGRVIVRSSSPLEGDGRWAGAFSSVTGVGREDVATAVRSCWAAAFAVDPLRRLDAYGLPLEALELAVLLQPEITPEAGGLARTEPGSGAGPEVIIEGIRGHPGALFSGWAQGATARVADAGPDPAEDGGLAALIGPGMVTDVAGLAGRVRAELGDDVIEWAATRGTAWLLQSGRSAPRGGQATTAHDTLVPVAAATAASDTGMAAIAALIRQRGARVPAQPAAPGTAAGPLVPCRPHEPAAGGARDAILLVDRPVPALAPLLFGARGIISRSGAAGSHLAGVARSLGVPMVTGCRVETITGSDPAAGAWMAVIDGATGEAALAPGAPEPLR